MQPDNLLNPEEKSILYPTQQTLTVARRIGILLLLQLIAALMLPFILTQPITVGSPAFLTAVAANSFQIRSAVLLSFVGSALTVYLGITAFQVIKRYSEPAALLFVLVCVISCILDVVHAGTIMSMLAISNQFVTSDTATSDLYQVVGAAVSSARRSAHIMQLVAIGSWMFIFYILFLRFKLIPVVLAVIGVIGVVSQFVGVTLMMLLGYSPIGEMAMPLLPIQITVGLWLIIKGFNKPIIKPAMDSGI